MRDNAVEYRSAKGPAAAPIPPWDHDPALICKSNWKVSRTHLRNCLQGRRWVVFLTDR